MRKCVLLHNNSASKFDEKLALVLDLFREAEWCEESSGLSTSLWS